MPYSQQKKINKSVFYPLIFVFCFSGAFAMDEDARDFNKNLKGVMRNLKPIPLQTGNELNHILYSGCLDCKEKANKFWKTHSGSHPAVSALVNESLSFNFLKKPSKCFSCGAKKFLSEDIPEFFTEDVPEFFSNFFDNLPEQLPIIRGCVKVYKANEKLDTYRETGEGDYNQIAYELRDGASQIGLDLIEYGSKGIKLGVGINDFIKQ